MSDAGRYGLIYSRLFRDPRFKKLKASTRELMLYVLAGPQRNAIGLMVFSIATAGEELGVSSETVRKGLADICTTFGWGFDADARVLYIPGWWKWNRPQNENVLKGNLKALSEIPPCGLVDAFARNLETLPETLHRTFLECLRIRLPIQDHYPQHLQNQDQEHDRDAARQASQKAKGGSDEKRFVPIAREALKLTHPAAPIQELIDTFFQLPKAKSATRSQATEAINQALAERRAS